MSEWQKVWPSAADKIFVSAVDADSPTGFGLVEKSTSEVKTLLNVDDLEDKHPLRVLKMTITMDASAPSAAVSIFHDDFGYVEATYGEGDSIRFDGVSRLVMQFPSGTSFKSSAWLRMTATPGNINSGKYVLALLEASESLTFYTYDFAAGSQYTGSTTFTVIIEEFDSYASASIVAPPPLP